jgi:hypothetical protein
MHEREGPEMKYTKLGNSDLNVSRICMGCMGFGDAGKGQHSWTLDEEQSKAIIKRGLDLGVNFFDTAIAYQSGTSEQYLGRALKDLARREDVVVATKFLPRTPEEIEKGISGQQHVENMINMSLKNLGYELSGKTVIPFCSHGGGRFGQSITAIAKLAPNSVIGKGLSVHYTGGASMPKDVTEWLKENGIK